AELGEGPHWDPVEGKLNWVDIDGKELRVYDPLSGSEDIYSFEKKVGAAVPADGGGWILALEDGIYRFKINEPLELLALVEAELPGNRLNDAKCDSRGRLWFGSMNMKNKGRGGSLYVMESGGEVRKVLSGIGISNGLAWNDSLGLMYYIDTLTFAVDVLDYTLQDGSVSGRRTAVQFAEGEGWPDGMTIDSEGMLWVAHWAGGCVSRWNPHTGEQIGRIEVPAHYVTSCTFGGENLDELYITTARGSMSPEELERWPLAGGLFKIKPGVKGMKGIASCL
ncbi:hypothetical protein KC345_g11737, partial [Hortaea werneckii]